jgi:hypothetical protein
MNDDFETAGPVIQILEVVGWMTVAGGLILAFNVFNERGSTWLEVVLMLTISLGGLFQIATMRGLRAVIFVARKSNELVQLGHKADLRAQRSAEATRLIATDRNSQS